MNWKCPFDLGKRFPGTHRIESVRRALVGVVCILVATHQAAAQQPARLALSSQIQYSNVIQGAIDPINAFVYNLAPPGSAALNYTVTAGLLFNQSIQFPTDTGTLPANGGTVDRNVTFDLNTATLSPGTQSVFVTASNTAPGGTVVTQGGSINVLAHAAPALVIGNQIVPFSKQYIFAFSALAQAPPTGTDAASTFAPQMIGDPPPGVPTAELDIDSVTSVGSPYITSTLAPMDDLPSTDTPGTGETFSLTAAVPLTNVEYSTTFIVLYSDEQDLPGADAPGSEEARFNASVDITDGIADWTITTGGAVPDQTNTAALLLGVAACLIGWTVVVKEARFSNQ